MSTSIIASQSLVPSNPGVVATLSSGPLTYTLDKFVQCSCQNGGAGPLSGCSVSLQITNAQGGFVTVDTRKFGLGAGAISYEVFRLVDYAGCAPGGFAGLPPILAQLGSVNVLANYQIVFTSDTRNSVTVAAWSDGGGSGGGGTPGGTSGQIEYNQSGSFGGFTMSGDATLVTSTGAITVTKTSGAAFAASATTNACNATNITSGTLPVAQLPTTGLTITEWTSPVTAATVTSNACTCDASVAEKWTVALGSGVATTITLANIAVGQTLEITTFQPGSGSAGTITWAGQTVRWTGGTAGAATATLSIGDTFVFACRSAGIISGAIAVPNF